MYDLILFLIKFLFFSFADLLKLLIIEKIANGNITGLYMSYAVKYFLMAINVFLF